MKRKIPEKAELRKKTARVARTLERFLGVPVPSKRKAPALDILIATLLSQNTNDRNSHRAYAQLRDRYPKWQHVLDAPVGQLADTIRVGGMANQKSRRIKKILRTVRKLNGSFSLRFLGTMSDEEVLEKLLSFDGVGLKTAACVLVFSLGRDVFPVDTHIHRICGRLGLSAGCTTPEKTFQAMRELVPRGRAYSFHTNLIRFGRKICKAQRPLCSACPVYGDCAWGNKRKFAARKSPVQDRPDVDFMVLDSV